MIYGNTNHPVEIKKIKIRIWTLRDELEAVVRERIKNSPLDLKGIKINDLFEEYEGEIGLPQTYIDDIEGANSNTLEIVDDVAGAGELDDSEDEMAKALADAEAAEAGGDESDVADAGELDDSEDAMMAAMNAGPSEEEKEKAAEIEKNKNVIRRRKPILDQQAQSPGIVFLSDINMDGLAFFSKKQFLTGQSIIIEFLIPNTFVVSGQVLFCRKYNMASKIISPTRPDFRIHSRFTFSREGERTLLRRFVQSIQPDIPPEVKAKPKIEDDDDLDDLDELGL